MLPVVESTNQYLLDRIYNLSSGDTCIAEYQQLGRGSHGRHWFSPFGSNLYFSIFWRFYRSPVYITGLSLVIGIMIADILRELGVVNIKVKWPNDLYLNYKKLAGILVEIIHKKNNVINAVIGVGINVSMHSVDTAIINQKWVDLRQAGININRNELIIFLLNRLYKALFFFEKKGLSPFIQHWYDLDYFIDKPVQMLIGKYKINGIARGIDNHGALLISREGQILRFFSGALSLRDIH